MKISKKALSLLLAIIIVFSVIPNSLASAAEKSSAVNTYQNSSHDSDNSLGSDIINIGVPATGFTLDKTSLTLENGNSETLTATFTPVDASDQEVFWSTSNSTVCTVDKDGKVTAVGNGSAVITVLAHDGGFFAKCKVSVITSITGITINKTKMSIARGAKETLIAKATPGGIYPDIIWSSSDESICTVDSSGNVAALNVGTAKISATIKDSGYTISCLVTVFAPVTGVTLNKTELTLENGKSETLIPTVNPSDATDQRVFWTYSDGLVCTVDQNGKVTAVGTGSASISVSTYDGSFTAICNVNVTDSIPTIKSITLNKTEMTLVKGTKETLIATVIPTDKQNELLWFSTNPKVCTVDSSGNVTSISEGTAYIFAYTMEGGCGASCNVTVVSSE